MIFVENHAAHRYFLPQKIGTATGQPSAEGATAPTVVVVRRIDFGCVKVQVVGVGRRPRRTRPIVAVGSDVSHLALQLRTNINPSATDKSQKQNSETDKRSCLILAQVLAGTKSTTLPQVLRLE